jgi:hypothetical protein
VKKGCRWCSLKAIKAARAKCAGEDRTLMQVLVLAAEQYGSLLFICLSLGSWRLSSIGV